MDQTRALNESLIGELNHLSESLCCLTTTLCLNTPKINPSKPLDTYLFQNAAIPQNSNNNNYVNPSADVPSAINSNCCPPPTNWMTMDRSPCFQPKLRTVFPQVKAMGCGAGFQRNNTPMPLCFPTPVVYTPEMETLFSSGGIIYARKSGMVCISNLLKMRFLVCFFFGREYMGCRKLGNID